MLARDNFHDIPSDKRKKKALLVIFTYKNFKRHWVTINFKHPSAFDWEQPFLYQTFETQKIRVILKGNPDVLSDFLKIFNFGDNFVSKFLMGKKETFF